MVNVVRVACVTVYVVVLIYAASALVGFAAERGFLIAAALPLPLIPILGLHFLRNNEKLAGWAAFTVWLGGTYAMGGVHSEVMVFGAIVAVAVAGYYRSPWLLVAAWFFHIGWDFVPRELPPLMADLPTACLVFDGLIGCYLAWVTFKGKLTAPVIERVS